MRKENREDNTQRSTEDSLLEMAEREYKRLCGTEEAGEAEKAVGVNAGVEAADEDRPVELPAENKVKPAADVYVLSVAAGFLLGIAVGLVINRAALCIVLGIVIGCVAGLLYHYRQNRPVKGNETESEAAAEREAAEKEIADIPAVKDEEIERPGENEETNGDQADGQ